MDCVDNNVTPDGGGSPPTGNVTAICGGGGGGTTTTTIVSNTTTTTLAGGACEAIVMGNPIAGSYAISSIGSHCSTTTTTACTKDGDCPAGQTCVGTSAANVKLCTQNASDQTKVF